MGICKSFLNGDMVKEFISVVEILLEKDILQKLKDFQFSYLIIAHRL